MKTKTLPTSEPCRCGHSKLHHEEPGMYGCTAAIGLCRCPCWGYMVPDGPCIFSDECERGWHPAAAVCWQHGPSLSRAAIAKAEGR